MRTNYPLTLCLVTSLFVSACTTQYTSQMTKSALQVLSLKEKHQLSRSGKWRLPSDTAIFLSAPTMFNRYQIEYHLPSTRDSMHAAFLDALSRIFPNVSASDSLWRVDDALTLARESAAEILIVPSLQLVVNDQKTLSGYEARQLDEPDIIYALDTTVIRVAIYDVISGNLLDVINIDSRGKLYKPKKYSLASFVGRAAMTFSQAISGRELAPFG